MPRFDTGDRGKNTANTAQNSKDARNEHPLKCSERVAFFSHSVPRQGGVIIQKIKNNWI